jgi:hypothetical protein
MNLRPAVAICCLALILGAICGCGNRPVRQGSGATTDASNAAPDSGESSSFETPAVSDDQSQSGAESASTLAGGEASPTDLAGSDPLSKELPDQSQGHDGLAGNYEPDSRQQALAPNSNPLLGVRQVKNWYWIRGSVFGGRVVVSINHLPIGSFTTHVDTEITDNLREGYNDVTFERIPSTTRTPIRAHLEIVYSQQPSGAPPVLVFDTEQMARTAAVTGGQGSQESMAGVDSWQHRDQSKQPTYSRQTDSLSFDAI